MLQVLTKNTVNFNSYLFRRPSRPGDEVSREAPQTGLEDDETQRQPLRCAACGHLISYVEARCTRAGSHEHMQVNPHGITFVFGCFTDAPGVIGVGQPLTEFSWFAGHEWQIVVCENCQIHLGWRFSQPQDDFFGLLLNMLQG